MKKETRSVWPKGALEEIVKLWTAGFEKQKAPFDIKPEQQEAFETYLLEELRGVEPDTVGLRPIKRISLSNQVSESEKITAAFSKAGIPLSTSLGAIPQKMTTALYEDGQILVSRGREAATRHIYDGTPSTPFIPFKEINVSETTYYRSSEICLIVSLPKGTKLKVPQEIQGEQKYAKCEIEEDCIAVISEGDLKPGVNIGALKQEHVFDLERNPWVKRIHMSYPELFFGARKGGDSTECQQLDEEGHYRQLSVPFEGKIVEKPFVSIGPYNSYIAAKPGDHLLKSVHPKTGAVSISWIPSEASPGVWLPTDNKGNLLDKTLPKVESVPAPVSQKKGFWARKFGL